MPDPTTNRVAPALSCATLLLAFLFLCLMPIIFVDAMQTALLRLHLSPQMATLVVLVIFLGGLVNIPVHRVERYEEQPLETMAVYGLWGFVPRFRTVRRETVIAVNVGGCIIPVILVIWQLRYLAESGGALGTLAVITALNVAVCYFAARPVPGIGIAMPGLLSPAVAVSLTWLLLSGDPEHRAPVAFVAGVLGPLVGADLFHLKDIARMSTGMLSIGGAGTFDGIVLSGVLAALVAGLGV